jgi:hypothetical protein
MNSRVEELVAELSQLPEEEQFAVIEGVFNALHASPVNEQVWAKEVEARREAFLAGSVATVDYEELRARYAKK